MTWRVRHTSWQLGLTWSQMPSSCHSDLDSICCWRNPPSPVTWGCLPAQNTAVSLRILPGQPPGTLGKDTSFVFMEKRTLTWQWEELLLASCMTLGKSLHFSQSQFTLLKNGSHYPLSGLPLGTVMRCTYFTDWRRQVDIKKAISQWGDGSWASIDVVSGVMAPAPGTPSPPGQEAAGLEDLE